MVNGGSGFIGLRARKPVVLVLAVDRGYVLHHSTGAESVRGTTQKRKIATEGDVQVKC